VSAAPAVSLISRPTGAPTVAPRGRGRQVGEARGKPIPTAARPGSRARREEPFRPLGPVAKWTRAAGSAHPEAAMQFRIVNRSAAIWDNIDTDAEVFLGLVMHTHWLAGRSIVVSKGFDAK
jgi:hypothetical protein